MTNEEAIVNMRKLRELYAMFSGNTFSLTCDKAIDALEQQIADGCEGCKYIHKDEFEMPCLNCKRNKMDYWRADERRTDE